MFTTIAGGTISHMPRFFPTGYVEYVGKGDIKRFLSTCIEYIIGLENLCYNRFWGNGAQEVSDYTYGGCLPYH